MAREPCCVPVWHGSDRQDEQYAQHSVWFVERSQQGRRAMRRILSLVLILASSWMLYQALMGFGGVNALQVPGALSHALSDANFIIPLLGAVLGLLGGITVFLGGAGGATIAFCGGLIASGFSLISGGVIAIPDLRFWENDVTVAIGMLAIAGWAAFSPASDG